MISMKTLAKIGTIINLISILFAGISFWGDALAYGLLFIFAIPTTLPLAHYGFRKEQDGN